VQKLIRKRCLGWLDEHIPALGGLSPRVACATAEGSRKVERMIRGYPNPAGMPGVEVPREEMLRELGMA
jgi:hypothetical protein